MTGKVVRVGFHINRFGELESIKHEEIQTGNGQIKQVRVFIFLQTQYFKNHGHQLQNTLSWKLSCCIWTLNLINKPFQIFRDSPRSGDVYVLTNDWITFLPLQTDCSVHTTCQGCSNAFPGCGWCVSPTLRSTCTRSDQCASKSSSWKSAFERCSPLADFKIKPTVNLLFQS